MARSYSQYFLPLLRKLKFLSLIKPEESMPDEAVTIDYLLDNHWVVGDPEYCFERIRQVYDRVGGFGTLLLVAQDWDPPEIGWKSLELFSKEVAPKLRGLVPNGA
jgi:alkanesulfonate monooxygenase SsuD/methylene tetrahydromethanopterin reductase-like flavin-dependent oxidoreductase (luciferase family)